MQNPEVKTIKVILDYPGEERKEVGELFDRVLEVVERYHEEEKR